MDFSRFYVGSRVDLGISSLGLFHGGVTADKEADFVASTNARAGFG